MPGVQYEIRRPDKAGVPRLDGYTFDDPAEAAATAKRLSKELGEKLMVKPITDDKWRQREQKRINDGTYRPMPWALDNWWNFPTAIAIWKDQYPHPSLERPGWIAYTKSPEEGAKDHQAIVRPGAYLKQFSRVLDHYGVSERRAVEKFMLAYGPIDIKFAATEEEIIEVYNHGPETCMNVEGRDWPGDGRNPAYIYAAGDLQVAYLGDLEEASARTVVWPEKKIYSRVYGDIARLTAGLERLGYKWGAPIGAKLKRVQLREPKFDPRKGPPSHCFVAPYLDKLNQRGGGHLAIVDKGDHLEIVPEFTPGSHHCGLADGCSGQYVPRQDEQPTFTCDRCEQPGHKELHTVYLDAECEEEQAWCVRCAGGYTFVCAYSHNRISVEVEYVMVAGQPWNKYYADMYATKCDMTGELWPADQLTTVYLEDGPKHVNPNWIERAGGIQKSSVTNRYFLTRDTVYALCTDYGHRRLGKSEVKYHAFNCDECRVLCMNKDRVQHDDKLICYVCEEQKNAPKKAKARKAVTYTQDLRERF